MASPTLDLVCCRVWNFTLRPAYNSSTITKREETLTFIRVFDICALLSATFSIIGAIYILLPKKSYVPRQRRSFRAVERQKRILMWLSVADIFACIGVFVIAIIGLVDTRTLKIDISESEGLRWLCIIATGWIQYFYVVTYFWTFFYAFDVNLMLRRSNRKMFPLYFIVSWLLPAVMVLAGIITLYESSAQKLECDPTFKRWRTLLPHYLASYIPMLIVLIFNPVMYWFSAKKVGPLLMRGGMYTDREREIQRQVQRKFLLIILVFTVCWLPNVINSFILMHNLVDQKFSWHTYGTFNEFIWVAMAIMNPLQAFLNALIYWGPGGCTRNVPTQFDSDYAVYNHRVMSNNHPDRIASDSADENTPLVWGSPTRRGDGRK